MPQTFSDKISAQAQKFRIFEKKLCLGVRSPWYEELKKTFDEGYSWVSFNLLQSVQSCGRRQLCTYEKCYLQQLRYYQARQNIWGHMAER